MRIIEDSWLHEPRAKILGMRARASRAVGPHKVGAYDNYTQYIRRPIFSGVVAMVCGPCGSAPQIFSA